MKTTPFSLVYDSFLSKITDDMYMQLTQLQTYPLLFELLISAIHKFQFPRVDLNDYEQLGVEDAGCYCGEDSNYYCAPAVIYAGGYFNHALTAQEINILSTYMVVEWIGQQLASIENVRMKYSGSDFKISSQASHLNRLIALKKEYQRQGFHLQRLYKRRAVGKDGKLHSTFGTIIDAPPAEWELVEDKER